MQEENLNNIDEELQELTQEGKAKQKSDKDAQQIRREMIIKINKANGIEPTEGQIIADSLFIDSINERIKLEGIEYGKPHSHQIIIKDMWKQ